MPSETMNWTQVLAIPESSDDLHPNKMEAVVLTINLLSLKFSSEYYPTAFRPVLDELDHGVLHCAANARDEIYLQLGARLQGRDASEEQLEHDLFKLLQEKKTPHGQKFEPLFDAEPDQDSDNETVLRALKEELRAQNVKNNLNLNVRVDSVSNGQFDNKTGDEILLRIEGIERKLDAIMGLVEPLRSPADGNGPYTFIPESE
ncbi:hypothetical protein H9Q74_008902 [Fusarium xylarioides]|nr:hypothetical protein H9Q71_007985 [Fusarium xylarioides]KAG5820356.1 hypothetical protein H9Q74_008902 [Fusarium xylarioides]